MHENKYDTNFDKKACALIIFLYKNFVNLFS